MKLVNLIEEDFTNYRKPGMFLGFPYCSGKCNLPNEAPICQNHPLRNAKLIDISPEEVIRRYRNSRIAKALIFGGLEPFDSPINDLLSLIRELRHNGRLQYSWDPVIIYTGYYPFEIKEKISKIIEVNADHDLIIKFGRYIPGHQPHYDPILGVNLASDNQYALQYTWEEAGPVWNMGE